MSYEVQDNLLTTIARQFVQPVPARRQRVLFIIFGVLLLLVILGCTVGPSPIVAVGLIIGVAVCIGAIWKPRLALYIAFMGAGLPALLLPLPGHNIRPVEAGLWLCLLVTILWRPQLRLRLPHLLALLFLAIAFISFIHVPERSTSVNAYTADKRLYGIVLIVLAFFCGALLVKYVKDGSSFLVTVLLSNIPLYLIALAQALHIHLPSMLMLSDPAQSDGRLPGPFGGAVGFGMYLVNLFAVALACWILSERRRDRIVGACMTIATALAIIGSGTRSVAIGATIVVIVSFTLTRRFKLLVGVLVLAGVIVAAFSQKILPLFTHDATSSSNRLFLWQEAIKLIAAHPWIGIGLWQFPKYYALLIVSQGAQLNPHGGVSIHEQYLEWAMESGIFWFIIGILLLLSITYFCWRAYRLAPRKQQVILLAAILAMLANIVIGFFDVPLDETEGAIFLFLLAGLALGYAEHIRRSISAQKATVPVSRILPAIGSVQSWPLPRQSRVDESPQEQSTPSTGVEASARDSAPNTQKTGRSVIIQLLSWAIPVPIIFPMTALLTRYLGPTQYGEYNFILSLLAILVLFSGNGIDPLVLRQLSRKPRAEWRETLSYAVGTRLLVITLIVGAIVLVAIISPISAELRNLLLLGSVSLFFSFSVGSLRTTFEIGFRLEQRITMISLLMTIDRIVTAGLVGFIVFFHLPLLWACFLIIYSDVPFFVIQVVLARRRFGIRVNLHLVRAYKLFLQGLHLIGYNIMSIIAAQADLLLLMALAGAQSVGLYALASRITDPLLSIVLAYALGLYPLLCAKFGEGREQFATVYHESIRILALAIIPLAIFVSVEAKAIVALLGGQHFAAATIAVQLLMWAMAITFFNQLAVRACMAAHLERRMMYVTVISSAVNILANLALIPHWQIMGAGIASLLSELVGFSLFTVLLRHHIHVFSIMGTVFRVFLGNLPMLLFLIWWHQASLLLTAPLALIMTIIGCLITRTLSLKDVHLMQHILHGRRNKGALKDVSDQPTTVLPQVWDITTWPTTMLPQVRDVADWPTVMMPKI